MKCALFTAFMVLTLSGCTIYRSEGRKQFESEAPGKVSTSSNFELKSCKKESRIETWFHEEFPSSNYEMVVMENDLEIWRTHRGSKVEIKAIQKSETSVHSCIYEFANDIVWNLYKDSFIRELEDNVMTLE
ncbi:hypothetical protein AZI87_13635 [Bdellovibrio bacteriovorus]|uniref:Lipoprotein n=1 Tax=Bdellovibrio bacteriovorus TaxID=959 RepID=A0A162G3Z0_BDEBC|nr:hypothetical protein [Bdellovibrio bacteriovorus]KYG64273.1 hypothetical protein AZI87_13635 [Bdellovibrio bacteriovorus]